MNLAHFCSDGNMYTMMNVSFTLIELLNDKKINVLMKICYGMPDNVAVEFNSTNVDRLYLWMEKKKYLQNVGCFCHGLILHVQFI